MRMRRAYRAYFGLVCALVAAVFGAVLWNSTRHGTGADSAHAPPTPEVRSAPQKGLQLPQTQPQPAAAKTKDMPRRRSLPSTGTPLQQIQDELAVRAANGDAAAASQLFRDTQECRHVYAFVKGEQNAAAASARVRASLSRQH